jgi:hypothetical protein
MFEKGDARLRKYLNSDDWFRPGLKVDVSGLAGKHILESPLKLGVQKTPSNQQLQAVDSASRLNRIVGVPETDRGHEHIISAK